MANLDLIRKQLKKLQAGFGKGSNNSWKPEEGKQVVRIVPYAHCPENPFVELFFYYKSADSWAKKIYISPSSFGKPDPVLEYIDFLQASGDKELWNTGRKMRPKMRIYVPVLVRGKESEGPKWWGFGTQVYEALLGIMDDPDYGDITDMKSGHDFTVELVKATTKGEYDKTNILTKPKPTAATEDPKVLDMIAKMEKIEDTFEHQIFSYESMKNDFDRWLNEGVDESPSETVVQSTSNVQVGVPKTASAKVTIHSDATNSLNLSSDELDDVLGSVPTTNKQVGPKSPIDVEKEFEDLFGEG